MKIYEIGTGYTPIPAKMGAATEIVVEELTKSLLKNGCDVEIVDILATDRQENNLPIIEVKVPNRFTNTDVQLGIMHKLKRVIYSIALAKKLKELIKNSQDKVVIHFHNQYNMFFFLKLVPANIRKQCYIAYTNHSYIWHGEWEDINKIVKKRYFQEITCMKNADSVYVLNRNTVDTLSRYVRIPKRKIHLIDNGVNIDTYCPLDESQIKEFKSELGIDGKKIYLQIGSVCERKNQLGAIELILPLLKNDKNSLFMYAGGIISEEYQNKIKDYSKRYGIEEQVLYMGELEPGKELNKYYNVAEVMVFPSKSEGFSLVIIEAMSAGIPVIIHNNLQFKLANECLTYSNKKEFLDIVNNQILDKQRRSKLSNKVRNSIIENYSWDKIAEDYLESWNGGKSI